jgi:hypothetical protein
MYIKIAVLSLLVIALVFGVLMVATPMHIDNHDWGSEDRHDGRS